MFITDKPQPRKHLFCFHITFFIWKVCKSDPEVTHSRLKSDVTKIQSGKNKKINPLWNKFWSIIFTEGPIMPFHFIQFWWKAGENDAYLSMCCYSLFCLRAFGFRRDMLNYPANNSKALTSRHPEGEQPQWSFLLLDQNFEVFQLDQCLRKDCSPLFLMACAVLPLGSRKCVPWTLPVGFANTQAEEGDPEATPKQLCF